ncbi:hypothetical protein [Flavobacterium cerinum]|uniref:Lipoprotein n=1 Tax=Flavobacterium cerinum TaxID=2502784 RepID=A0ABY5ITX8_9FLAO|nr:hypothetical protein [Flavobacterium cerinum]UUC44809.1 hypothetical protein NOX80_14380 [Flavobacterium cerinum]
MNKIFFLSVIFIFLSCEKIDCERLSKITREEECLLVVKKINDSNSVYNFDINGQSLKTFKDTLYKEQNRWFCTYYKYLVKGDTIIKRKGELVFNIHKKDTILSFNWECEGKVYK